MACHALVLLNGACWLFPAIVVDRAATIFGATVTYLVNGEGNAFAVFRLGRAGFGSRRHGVAHIGGTGH